MVEGGRLSPVPWQLSWQWAYSNPQAVALNHVDGRPHLLPRVLPSAQAPNSMGFYSFTDSVGVEGWVGLVGWLIAFYTVIHSKICVLFLHSAEWHTSCSVKGAEWPCTSRPLLLSQGTTYMCASVCYAIILSKMFHSALKVVCNSVSHSEQNIGLTLLCRKCRETHGTL